MPRLPGSRLLLILLVENLEWCTPVEKAMQPVSVAPADVDDEGQFLL
jgi:hypothetical protein